MIITAVTVLADVAPPRSSGSTVWVVGVAVVLLAAAVVVLLRRRK